MKPFHFDPSRRLFLTQCTLGAAAFTVPGAFAGELVRTPPQTEGPFYPDRLPLDTDNDLIIVNDQVTPAIGKITHLTGRVLDLSGNPVRNAVVEIWQVNHHGTYLHSQDAKRGKPDKNFQGFGRFLTGSKGEYYFRTIKPVPYTGRTPHIHVKVKIKGKDVLTTQFYVKDEKLNARDFIFNRIKKDLQKSVLVDFKPIKKSRIGELAANFDIVLGMTPKDG